MLLRRYHYHETDISKLSETAVEKVTDLSKMTVKELKELARNNGIEGYSTLDKEALIKVLLDKE